MKLTLFTEKKIPKAITNSYITMTYIYPVGTHSYNSSFPVKSMLLHSS